MFENEIAQVQQGIENLVELTHNASKARGWWHDPLTGHSLIPKNDVDCSKGYCDTANQIVELWFPYVIATKIALIHSETSEGLEAYRTDAMDDKIPEFAGITAEMADVLIRIGDLMGCLQAYVMKDAERGNASAYDLSAAIEAKMLVNAVRPDHNPEARRKPGGKKF